MTGNVRGERRLLETRVNRRDPSSGGGNFAPRSEFITVRGKPSTRRDKSRKSLRICEGMFSDARRNLAVLVGESRESVREKSAFQTTASVRFAAIYAQHAIDRIKLRDSEHPSFLSPVG